MGRDWTLSGECMMQYADDVLQSCTLETYIVLLTNVTTINSIEKKIQEKKKEEKKEKIFSKDQIPGTTRKISYEPEAEGVTVKSFY